MRKEVIIDGAIYSKKEPLYQNLQSISSEKETGTNEAYYNVPTSITLLKSNQMNNVSVEPSSIVENTYVNLPVSRPTYVNKRKMKKKLEEKNEEPKQINGQVKKIPVRKSEMQEKGSESLYFKKPQSKDSSQKSVKISYRKRKEMEEISRQVPRASIGDDLVDSASLLEQVNQALNFNLDPSH